MRWTIMVACFLAFCLLSAQCFAKDYAFATTKWGMTPTQVEHALGKKLTFVMVNKVGNDVYELTEHNIEQMSYKVTLFFDFNGLSSVLMYAKDNYAALNMACHNAEKRFLERFGSPIKNASDKMIKRFTWESNYTEVDLSCNGNKESEGSIFIIYNKANAERRKSF